MEDRHSFRYGNRLHPQSTAYRAPEEKWIGSPTPVARRTPPTYIAVDAGVDRMLMEAGTSDLSSYDIFNNVANGTMAMEMFGTNFLTMIEVDAGSDGMSMRADLGVTGYIATGSIVPLIPPVSFTDQTLDGDWNTLPNGGFESGLTSWTAQGGPGGGPVNGTFATSNEFHILGAASARSQPIIDFTGPGFAIFQDVAVIPGKTYVLSGFTYVPTSGSEAHFRFDVDWALLEVYASGSNGQWQFNYAKFKGPADQNARIRVVEDNIVHKPDVGYFDEVAVTPLELFHPPSYVTGNFLGYSAAGNALTSPFTDYISGPGNLLSYDIYNNIGNGAMAMAMFGTHFLATIEAGFQGTDHGSHVTEAFGTYMSVIVYGDAGTDHGTIPTEAFGTYYNVIIATDAGTNSGTLSAEFYGGHTEVTVDAGTKTDAFSMVSSFYGTYLSI